MLFPFKAAINTKAIKMLRAYTIYTKAQLEQKGVWSATPKVPLFINGEFIESKSQEWMPVHNPANQKILCLVPQATADEMQYAVKSASDAFRTWKQTSIVHRQQRMFELQRLIKANMVNTSAF